MGRGDVIEPQAFIYMLYDTPESSLYHSNCI